MQKEGCFKFDVDVCVCICLALELSNAQYLRRICIIFLILACIFISESDTFENTFTINVQGQNKRSRIEKSVLSLILVRTSIQLKIIFV